MVPFPECGATTNQYSGARRGRAWQTQTVARFDRSAPELQPRSASDHAVGVVFLARIKSPPFYPPHDLALGSLRFVARVALALDECPLLSMWNVLARPQLSSKPVDTVSRRRRRTGTSNSRQKPTRIHMSKNGFLRRPTDRDRSTFIASHNETAEEINAPGCTKPG
jgi:hypothetical protein